MGGAERARESVASNTAIIQFCDCAGWRGSHSKRPVHSQFLRDHVLTRRVMQGGVFTLLYQEVFSPNSRTWQFEKAVGRIKDDPRCTDLLGDRRKLKAYGENTWSRWARNRPIAYVALAVPVLQCES